MEERKIGEVFKHGETWLQCVKDDNCCLDCFFNRGGHCINDNILACSVAKRSDKERVIFKELLEELPVGFEFIYQGRKLRVEEYKGIKDEIPLLLRQCKKCALCDDDGECLIDEYFPSCFGDTRKDEKNIIYREVTDDVKEPKHKTIKFKYMEPERKKLTIPEGWEFDKLENGEIFIKSKKPTLPDTWEECLCVVDYVEQLNDCSEIHDCFMKAEQLAGHNIDDGDLSMLPRGMGRPMLALCQLLVCRNAWWKILGWKPDGENSASDKFVIESCGGNIRCNVYEHIQRILAFPTREVRDKFLETFKDLIEEAKELL